MFFFIYRAIFHLDEADDFRIKLVLNNINNLLDDLDDVKIELVANAQGVKLLQKDKAHQERLVKLQNRGVTLVAGNKSLQSLLLEPEDLLERVKTVPSGVGELVQKQQEGWSYIRP